ncbi:hypothetical protein HZH66_007610 [Vespula vulgaris]|uniref:Uncharacterized protein n=1 Tax=Vespula vulgaris TaxID=7454 RepID=A0A834JY80_VESVU|nr:hypothetical protein HZH66_007610 [Vespula vulgaris]
MQSEEILALRRRKFIRFFSFDKRDDSRERKRSGNELIAESEIGRQLLRSMTHDDYVQTLTTARQQIDIAPLPDELVYSHSPEADDGSAAGTGPPRRRNSLKEPEEAPSHLLNDIDL